MEEEAGGAPGDVGRPRSRPRRRRDLAPSARRRGAKRPAEVAGDLDGLMKRLRVCEEPAAAERCAECERLSRDLERPAAAERSAEREGPPRERDPDQPAAAERCAECGRLSRELEEARRQNDILRRGILVVYNKKMHEWRRWVLGREAGDKDCAGDTPRWVQGW